MLSVGLVVYQLLPTILVGYVAWSITRFLMRYRLWNKVYSKAAQLGPRHPILGHTHLFQDGASFLKLTIDVANRTRAKIYCGWIYCYPTTGVCHPETAKILLKSSSPKPKGFGGPYEAIKEWLGDGLLLSDGPKWERNRRLLTPAFHFEILQPYFQIYNSVSEVFHKNLQDEAKLGESIEIYQFVCMATLDTMLQCALSYKDDVQSREHVHPYAVAVARLTYLVQRKQLTPIQWYDTLYFNLMSEGREYKRLSKYVHEFADNIIKSRRTTLESDPSQIKKRKLDFLDILLTAKDEHGAGLSDQDIRAEVDTFLFEGHDTTASAISWALYALAKYPAEQEKVADDVRRVVGEAKVIESKDLPEMTYLNLFIREVMRMFSPVPMISRRLQEDTVFDGVWVPAELSVDINIATIHHHPDVYPDHEVFRPDRFNNDNSDSRDPYAFVPFSAGPRNCIGQNFAMHEIKVFISRFVQRFKVSLDLDHEVIMLPQSVMRAKNGIKIFLQER